MAARARRRQVGETGERDVDHDQRNQLIDCRDEGLGLDAAQAGWIDVSEGSGYYVYYWGPYIWWLLTAGFAALYLTQRGLPARLLDATIVVLLVF